ncbi:SpoIIE family protein phosphatase [Streptomyces sp. NBC_01727]|uniref:SpoIIE family protein phosphatase n=1 Tax=Streptomyces sp. NBC_01727 TaxID=2975924 RepID=UPI002E14AAE6|nr:SpoIIE family protein phosphatase [Streptomyces sp. NBC_01727]
MDATGVEQSVPEVLRIALQHVVAELSGLGSMVHLSGLEFSWARLLLLASTGLPSTVTHMWQAVSRNGSAAPAIAFRDREYIWIPSIGGLGPEPAASPAPGLPVDVGMAAVVLPASVGRPLGTLSVLTPAHREPGPAQQEFLEDAARWVANWLRSLTETEPEQGGLSPALLRLSLGQRSAEAPESATGTTGNWECDLATGEMRIDAQLLDALGIDDFDGRVDSWFSLFHPGDLPRAMVALRHNLRKIIADHEWRVRRTDGNYSWVRVQSWPLETTGSEPARSVGSMTVTTGTHDAAESAGRTLEHMTDGFLSVRLGRIESVRLGRIEYLNPAAERLFGPFRDVISQRLWEVPAMKQMPGLAEQCRRAIAKPAATEFDVQWPGSDRWYHVRLQPTEGGLMTVYITDITDKRLRKAAERAAAEREALAEDLNRALAQARTAADVVAAVADTLLPALGATGLAVLTLDGDRLQLLGSAGFPPEFRRRMHDSSLSANTPASQALRTGSPVFIASSTEHALRFPEMADLPSHDGKGAWAFLPLRVSGRPVGTAVMAFDRPHQPVQDERTLLTTLSGLIAHAVERANLYDAAISDAKELQEVLLPRELPALSTVDTAVRYRPSTLRSAQPAAIGGDWYDVIRLSGGRVALVAGDVMGHGMREAATMGQLRTAVQTLSGRGLPPGEILAHLNDIDMGKYYDGFTATCLYSVYDPVARTCAYASAGHSPPALVFPDGTVTFPGVPLHMCPDGTLDFSGPLADPPLGAATPPVKTHTFDVPDGSLLVLYTDGLVESAQRDIGDGMGRLARILRSKHAGDLDPLCDEILASLLPPGQPAGDDAALLIARTHPLRSEDIADWDLPEKPEAAGEARSHVRDQLTAWGLAELETSCELVVSELVGNVIRYAPGPSQLRLLRTDRLICEVSDNSLTTPQIRHPSLYAEGGRGLYLVAATADHWGTRPTEHGKTIWAELDIHGGNHAEMLLSFNVDEIPAL